MLLVNRLAPSSEINIDSAIANYGFGGLYYYILPSFTERFDSELISQNVPEEVYKKQRCLYAVGSAKEVFSRGESHCLHEEEIKAANDNRSCTWIELEREPSKINRYLLAKGVATKVNFILENDRGWRCAFSLLSELGSSRLAPLVSGKLDILMKELVAYSDTINRRYADELNPLTNYGYISEKSHKVLQLLAQGMKVDEVAVVTHMTSRGVSYHINCLKELFDAPNLCSVIHRAHQEGVLN